MREFAVDDRETCYDCGEYLQEEELVHQISFAFWDVEESEFEKDEPSTESYCEDCWREIRPHKQGVEFEIDTVDELWEILSASDGRLVADCKPIVLGTRPFIRVTNGHAEVAVVKRRLAGENVIGHYSEFKQQDRDWFTDTVESFLDGDLPPLIYLRNSENTPFGEIYNVQNGQQTMTDFS